jgi:hypothetical protein
LSSTADVATAVDELAVTGAADTGWFGALDEIAAASMEAFRASMRLPSLVFAPDGMCRSTSVLRLVATQ